MNVNIYILKKTNTSDFMAILEKENKVIVINSASDTTDILNKFQDFCKENIEDKAKKCNILISSIRDEVDGVRKYLLNLEIFDTQKNFVLEIPLARITRRNIMNNNYDTALKWYEDSIDKLIQQILHQEPFNI